MSFSLSDRVAIPTKNAQVKNVTCEFCIVGCGYKAYKWPKGTEGTAKNNAIGLDLSKEQPVFGFWASQEMCNTVKDRDGKEYHVMVVPDHKCVVNEGQNSARGGAMGSTLFTATSFTSDRLQAPTIYSGGNMDITTWNDAISIIARVVKKVIDRDGADMVSHKTFDHGGGGGGFENTWGTGKLFHTAIGTSSASIHNRPAYNSEVFATRDMGMGELNSSYYDTELADTIFVIGANPYETQTNLFLMHMAKNFSGESIENKKKEYEKNETVGNGKFIIVDPRITATVENAKKMAGEENVLHLRIRPQTDITLMNTLVTYIKEKGWEAKDFVKNHTENFDAMYKVNKTSLKEGAKITGLSEADIIKAAEWIAKPKASGHRPRTSIYYEKGVIWGIKNYECIASIANLAFLTQSVGRVGTGCCRLGGHQEGYTRPEYHGPSRQNLKVIDEEITKGNYQVYFAWGCNPFVTSIMGERLRTTFAKRANIVKEAIDNNIGADDETIAEAIYQATKRGGLFFVDIDIYPTLKQKVAHVTLPAVTTMEMNITSMSGERRMRLSEKVLDGPGIAKPDCIIAADIANALKSLYKKEGNKKMAARFDGFEWRDEEDAFKDGFAGQGAKMASQGGPTGTLATYENLRNSGNNGVQLPITAVKNGKLEGSRHLYTDNKFGTKSGKATFLPSAQPSMPAPVAKQVAKYDYWVHSGRLNEVWQSGFHTSRLANVKERWPMAPVEINPTDAKKLDVVSGDLVMLYNDYGSVRAVVNVTDSVRPKEIFMAFGFPNSPVNNLVTEYVDPDTKIPFYKGTAASIKKLGKSSYLGTSMTFKERI